MRCGVVVADDAVAVRLQSCVVAEGASSIADEWMIAHSWVTRGVRTGWGAVVGVSSGPLLCAAGIESMVVGVVRVLSDCLNVVGVRAMSVVVGVARMVGRFWVEMVADCAGGV